MIVIVVKVLVKKIVHTKINLGQNLTFWVVIRRLQDKGSKKGKKLNVRTIYGVEIYLFEMTIKLDPAAMLPRRFAGDNHDDDDGDGEDEEDSEDDNQEQCNLS